MAHLRKGAGFGLRVEVPMMGTIGFDYGYGFDRANGPSWEPQGDWNAPGKRVYFEKAPKCLEYGVKQSTFCCACMASCPWSKPDTLLHKVSRAVAATVPAATPLMVKLDEVCGFGLKPPEKTTGWWNEKLTPRKMQRWRWS